MSTFAIGVNPDTRLWYLEYNGIVVETEPTSLEIAQDLIHWLEVDEQAATGENNEVQHPVS